MPLRDAAVAARLDQLEAEVLQQAATLDPAEFRQWFGGETAPLLYT